MSRIFKRLFKKRKKNTRRAPTRRAPVLESNERQTAPPRKSSGGGKRPVKRGRKKSVGRFAAFRAWAWPYIWKVGKPLLIIGSIALLLLWVTLPDIDDLDKVSKNPSIVMKSQGGDILATYGDTYGDYLPFSELPTSLIDAVIATEDRNFYKHFGVDPFGLARAMVANARAGKLVQGGSTVTQQVAKNVFLTPERTLLRKVREMFLAFKLEARFTKQQIMTIYLNRVYLGAGSYGVDAAARRYFGKSARELNLSESVVLTGLLKAPSRYAPTSNPELARKRAEQILVNMEDAGYLKPKQVESGKKELKTLLTKHAQSAQANMYYTDWIVDQLPDFVGSQPQDLVVTVTLNAKLQQAAEGAINEVMDKQSEPMNAEQASLLAMRPDGAVVALIGGRNYSGSQFNRAVQSKRQPGSAFKLFVYLTALEGGMNPETIVEDKPIKLGKWQPHNYNERYEGEMKLREALAQSINTVAVQLAVQFGIGNVIDMAEKLGITSDLDPDASLALGSNEVTLLELTTAYAHLAANGVVVEPYGILEIKNSAGKSLYKRKTENHYKVLRDDTVGMINEMLMDVVTVGTGRAAQIGRQIAGKTGTTSDYKDAWFVGFTPQLATGVWVGNDNATPMKKVTGGTLPAAIWKRFMAQAMAGLPEQSIPTSRGGFLDNILPWHEGGARDNGDSVHLGPAFWQKLMDGGKTDHKYPAQKH